MLSLTTTLKVNSISSGATGLGLVILSEMFATIFGVTVSAPFIMAGIFLVLFSFLVFKTSLEKPVNERMVRIIILLDSLWVIGSVIALFFLSPVITLVGSIMIALVAAWVTAMIYLQRRGLRDGNFSGA